MFALSCQNTGIKTTFNDIITFSRIMNVHKKGANHMIALLQYGQVCKCLKHEFFLMESSLGLFLRTRKITRRTERYPIESHHHYWKTTPQVVKLLRDKLSKSKLWAIDVANMAYLSKIASSWDLLDLNVKLQWSFHDLSGDFCLKTPRDQLDLKYTFLVLPPHSRLR